MAKSVKTTTRKKSVAVSPQETALKKTAPKKAAVKKTAAKKSVSKKSVSKKTAPKKTAPKKTAPKKPVASTSAKSAPKKSAAAPAKKATTKKVAAKKAPVKKAPAKKTPTKKVAKVATTAAKAKGEPRVKATAIKAAPKVKGAAKPRKRKNTEKMVDSGIVTLQLPAPKTNEFDLYLIDNRRVDDLLLPVGERFEGEGSVDFASRRRMLLSGCEIVMNQSMLWGKFKDCALKMLAGQIETDYGLLLQGFEYRAFRNSDDAVELYEMSQSLEPLDTDHDRFAYLGFLKAATTYFTRTGLGELRDDARLRMKTLIDDYPHLDEIKCLSVAITQGNPIIPVEVTKVVNENYTDMKSRVYSALESNPTTEKHVLPKVRKVYRQLTGRHDPIN